MKRILLVEDDRFIGDLTTAKLSQDGIAILPASSAAEADALLAETKIDLIILDLGLPDRDGLEYLHDLKHTPHVQDIPLIVFSNNDNPDVLRYCEKLGVHKFFVKVDTDYTDFIATVNGALN